MCALSQFVLQKIQHHARLDAMQEFPVEPDVRAFPAVSVAKAAAYFHTRKQIAFLQKPFYNFYVDVVSTGKAGTSHADGNDFFRLVHFAAPECIV